MGCSTSKSVSNVSLNGNHRSNSESKNGENSKDAGGGGKGGGVKSRTRAITNSDRDSKNGLENDEFNQKLEEKKSNSINKNNKENSSNHRLKLSPDNKNQTEANKRPMSQGILSKSKGLSESQTEFFRLLDEKIDKGGDYKSEDDRT